MDEHIGLAEQIAAYQPHLLSVAYRLRGSHSEADDAVQDAWLHVSRAGTGGVANRGGRLTTVVARVCRDLLRAHRAARGALGRGRTQADPEP